MLCVIIIHSHAKKVEYTFLAIYVIPSILASCSRNRYQNLVSRHHFFLTSKTSEKIVKMKENVQGINQKILFSHSTVHQYIAGPAKSKFAVRNEIPCLIFSNLKKAARDQDLQKLKRYEANLVSAAQKTSLCPIKQQSVDFRKSSPPYWILHLEFPKSDHRFVISDPKISLCQIWLQSVESLKIMITVFLRLKQKETF